MAFQFELLVSMTGITNGSNRTFWPQKGALKKIDENFIKFHQKNFIKKFHQFFKCYFLSPQCLVNLIYCATDVYVINYFINFLYSEI